MNHKYLNRATKKLKTKYGVNALEDVILGRPNRLILFAEKADSLEEIKMEVVGGNLTMIGFDNQPMILMKEIIDAFDYHSKYSEVAGRKEYFQTIYEELSKGIESLDTTLPIINSGGRFWIRISIVPVIANPKLIAIFITDVTQYLEDEEELFLKTHHDSLTNLFNKYTFDYHYGLRSKFENMHILFLDLDDFKIANDRFGHQKGDEYLREFAKILKTYEHDYNRFYRIGGDEFIGMFFEDKKTIKKIAKDIIESAKTLAKKISIDGTSVSIGIVKATKRDNVVKKADKLLYKAKEQGKNQFIYEVEKDE